MIKSCLFLDFDNVFSGLRNQSDIASKNFAEHPMDWLRWLENVDLYDSNEKRNILVRKCYLNPISFSEYRPYFVQSSFQVIDCPTLTTKGKNSADIYMVLDILTYLDHRTAFDEFIIMSADSDFTPILVKLRENNKKTIVAASGLTSIAYKNSSDIYFDQDSFIDVLETLSIEKKVPILRTINKKDEKSAQEKKGQIKATIDEFLQENNQIMLGSLALQLKRMYNVDDNWFGEGKFSKFVQSLNIENAVLDLTAPGFLVRSQPPEKRLASETNNALTELGELLGIPILSPAEYMALFQAIYDFMQENKYNLSVCSKFMRDQVNREGFTELSRKTCNYLLFGIYRSGVKFSKKESVKSYQTGFYDYIKMLVKINQIRFSDDDFEKVERMLGLPASKKTKT